MTSASSDRPASALSDNWATISNADAYSEDGRSSEHTDSISLIDQPVPDDVASLDDRDLDSGAETDDTESLASEARPYFSAFYPNRNEDTPVQQSAILGQTDADAFDDVEYRHTIRVLSSNDAHDLGLSGVNNSHLTLAIQQSMAKNALDLSKPFRVLYVGAPAYKSTILRKLGDVIVASPASVYAANATRYHVVPAAFDSDTTPKYAELLPMHAELVVDECTSTVPSIDPPGIQLNFTGSKPVVSMQTPNGYQWYSKEWTPPDIAIFFLGDRDATSHKSLQTNLLRVMERQNVPTFVITETPDWNNPHMLPVTLDERTPHMCLEARDMDTGLASVIARYPLDLDTFEYIAPSQLNRNLASLARPHTSKYQSRRLRDIVAEEEEEEFVDYDNSTLLEKLDALIAHNHAQAAFVCFLMIFLCCTGLGTMVVALFRTFYGVSNVSLSVAQESLSTPTPTTIVPHTTAPVLQAATPNAVSISGCDKDKALSLSDDIAKWSSPNVKQPNTTDKFQVFVVGDCHVIIKVPARMSSMRKSPNFEVKVMKAGRRLDVNISKLFENVYSLRLPREDAHGIMDVTISATSKPYDEQVTQVDFGTAWLKIASWKQAAQSLSYQLRKDLIAAQAGLSDAYTRVSSDLQSWKKDNSFMTRDPVKQVLKAATKATHVSKRYSEQVKENASKQMRESSKLLQKQAQHVKEEATEIVRGIWAKAQDYYANQIGPLLQNAKRSPPLATAQKNAQDVKQGWKKYKNSCEKKTCGRPCRKGVWR